jgi:hypothetical protein
MQRICLGQEIDPEDILLRLWRKLTIKECFNPPSYSAKAKEEFFIFGPIESFILENM